MTSETRPASKLTRCRVCSCKLKSGDICPRCEREQEWLNTPEYFCTSSLCGRFLPGATEPGLCSACEKLAEIPEKPLRKPTKSEIKVTKTETKPEPEAKSEPKIEPPGGKPMEKTEKCNDCNAPITARRKKQSGVCEKCYGKNWSKNRARVDQAAAPKAKPVKTYPAPPAPKTGAEKPVCNEAPKIFTHGLSDVKPNPKVIEVPGVGEYCPEPAEPAASTIHAAPPPHTTQPTAQPDLYRLALRKFGDRSQIMKTAEEAAELSAAITRYLSPVWNGKNPLPGLIEELADVEIMCRQMRLIFGEQMVDDAVKQKLARLERRLTE